MGNSLEKFGALAKKEGLERKGPFWWERDLEQEAFIRDL